MSDPKRLALVSQLYLYLLKSRQHRTYGPILGRERPCGYCRVYRPCWDNDATKSGMTARSDVTRGLWKNFGAPVKHETDSTLSATVESAGFPRTGKSRLHLLPA